MRKSVVIGATTLSLLFGSAGVAQATEFAAPVPATTTTVAQEMEHEDDGGDNGLWGLAGLLGLLGVLGLKLRKDTDHAVARTTGPTGTTLPPTAP